MCSPFLRNNGPRTGGVIEIAPDSQRDMKVGVRSGHQDNPLYFERISNAGF
jgi:hypothetical protein